MTARKVDDILSQFNGPDALRKSFSHSNGRAEERFGEVLFDKKTNEATGALVPPPEDSEGPVDDHRAYVEKMTGLKIPDHLDVVLERLSLYGGRDDDGYTGIDSKAAVKYWHKYKFVPKTTNSLNTYEGVGDMLVKVRKQNDKKVAPLYTGDGALNVCWNDWQVGKKEGGGTQAFLERFDYCIEAIVEHAKALKKLNKNIGQLNILGIGDIVEGCFIYPNQSFQIDLDRRAQINIAVSQIILGIERLAPLFERVNVVAVPGNHGEHRVGGKMINHTDNDDVLVFEIAARAFENRPRFEHVKFTIAHGEPAKTIEVCGHVIGITHGQVFGRGGSDPKAIYNWFRNMAAGRKPIGDADVLVTAHFHHKVTIDWGATELIQATALDGGSQHFSDSSGKYALPGMLTFVTTRENRATLIEVIQPPLTEHVRKELGLPPVREAA